MRYLMKEQRYDFFYENYVECDRKTYYKNSEIQILL